MADIDIGAISEALNNKTDRNMRNVDTGAKADSVIDYQEPTAENGYTWYRKYASGWVEQGGQTIFGAAVAVTVTLPIEMSDANYHTTISLFGNTSAYGSAMTGQYYTIWNRTTTSFQHMRYNGQEIQQMWQVSGMSA